MWQREGRETHPIALPVFVDQLPAQDVLVRLVAFAEDAEVVGGECQRGAGHVVADTLGATHCGLSKGSYMVIVVGVGWGLREINNLSTGRSKNEAFFRYRSMH